MQDRTEDCIRSQIKFCKDHKKLVFIPWDSRCYSCGKNIFADYDGSKGYPLDRAGSQLITGCPHCHRTFCD